MSFLDDRYLLDSEAAYEIYQEVEGLPIVDAHNHADAEEIVRNQNWSDIWEVEGKTDHYVWELMRRRGVKERLVTGDASNREKWTALAQVFPQFVGNPTYEWIQLDLKRRFGIDTLISKSTADEIWNATRRQLAEERMKPQALLEEMKVEVMCTTDAPAMKLPYHEAAKEELNSTRILPTWRPDKIMNPTHAEWKRIVVDLGEEAHEDSTRLSGLISALEKSHRYFRSLGCVASDHGIDEPATYYVDQKAAAQIHDKAVCGESLNPKEAADYRAFMLNLFGRFNMEAGWITQFHIGAVRDQRKSLLRALGTDSGGDVSTLTLELTRNLHYFLNEFDDKLSIVIYSLDPGHLPTLATLTRAFPNVIMGAPWWFNDTPYGMDAQLKYLAAVDLLANHAGMVTDSRKLISFGSRTEMFRRVLCNVLGQMLENGQAPFEAALEVARSLAYERPRNLFFANLG